MTVKESLPLRPKITSMKLEEILLKRSRNVCELCGSDNDLLLYEVLPQNGRNEDNCIISCSKCRAQVDKKEELDGGHWKCISETMWSEIPGVQVIAWRMLNRLRNERWAADLLDMLYLDDEKLVWAKATGSCGSDRNRRRNWG
jgi:protein PhnA